MKKELFCFVHIEKAAGTTMHHILANNFSNYLTISPTYYWSNEPGNYLSAKELKWLLKLTLPTQAIGGHPIRSYLQYEETTNREVKYITFLRDPVSRYLSHFKHQKFAKKIEWSFESFLKESRFNDYMTRRFSPSNNLEEAKTALLQPANFVGLMEHFDESLLLMKEKFSLSNFVPFYEKENVSSVNFSEEKLFSNPDFYEQTIKNNKNDIELYKFAKENIFAGYRSKYSKNLNNELIEFKRLNDGFKFNRENKLILRMYRLGYYKPMQYMLKFLLR